MRKINANRLGLALGAVMGLGHLGWAALVAAGWAQAVLDFVFQIHFIKPALQVGPFVPATAVILILVTSAAGFVGGLVLGAVWNWLHRAET